MCKKKKDTLVLSDTIYHYSNYPNVANSSKNAEYCNKKNCIFYHLHTPTLFEAINIIYSSFSYFIIKPTKNTYFISPKVPAAQWILRHAFVIPSPCLGSTSVVPS